MTVRRTFTLDDERDADILSRLDAEENTSAVVREALRAHYHLSLTLADILDAIRTLPVVQGNMLPPVASAEDAELSAALDALGIKTADVSQQTPA